jgi:hypothetical protein
MARWRLIAALVVAAAGLTVVGGASAITVSVLPNPSFEDNAATPCPPLPLTVICGWNSLVGTLTQDTIHHTGSFSMKLTNSDTSVEATTANGVCISPITAGVHAMSFWYLTSSPVVDVQMGVSWYPNTTCSTATFANSALHAPMPVTYGTWTQVTGTVTAPPTTGSAFFSLFASCQCTQPATVTAYFDDVAFGSTSAVTLVSFAAARSAGGVRVRWRTGTEADALGFHVYRERAGKRVRVDRRLIAAKGAVSGAGYSFLDRSAPHGRLTYRLQVVATDGTRAWYGPARSVVN